MPSVCECKGREITCPSGQSECPFSLELVTRLRYQSTLYTEAIMGAGTLQYSPLAATLYKHPMKFPVSP